MNFETKNQNETAKESSFTKEEQNRKEEEEWEQYSDNEYDEIDGINQPTQNQNQYQQELNQINSNSYYQKPNSYQKHFKKHNDSKPKGYYMSYNDRPYYKKSKIFPKEETKSPYVTDFINANSNYAKKPNDKRNYYFNTSTNININSNSNNNSNTYSFKYSYSNRSAMGKNEEAPEKPIFINSKLENNGNPKGNFISLEPLRDELPHFNFVPYGEVKPKEDKDKFMNRDKEVNKVDVIEQRDDIVIEIEKRHYDDYFHQGKNYNSRRFNHKNKYYSNESDYYYKRRKSYKGNKKEKFNLNQPMENANRKYSSNKVTIGNKFDLYSGGGTRK